MTPHSVLGGRAFLDDPGTGTRIHRQEDGENTRHASGGGCTWRADGLYPLCRASRAGPESRDARHGQSFCRAVAPRTVPMSRCSVSCGRGSLCFAPTTTAAYRQSPRAFLVFHGVDEACLLISKQSRIVPLPLLLLWHPQSRQLAPSQQHSNNVSSRPRPRYDAARSILRVRRPVDDPSRAAAQHQVQPLVNAWRQAPSAGHLVPSQTQLCATPLLRLERVHVQELAAQACLS
jgi:hypothetical protein